MRKLTDAILRERIFDKYGDTIKVLESFKGMHVKIGFSCSMGHEFPATPTSMLNKNNKTGCLHCGRILAHESQKNTIAEITALVTDKHGDLFQLVGRYLGRGVKTDWVCIKGHKLFSSPENILAAPGCKRCAGKVNNHEEYLDELKVRFGGVVWPLERYQGSRVKIMHECIKGHKFPASPNYVLYSVLGCCSTCSGNKRITNEEYDKEIESIHHGLVFRIGDYNGGSKRLLHGCGLCGRQFPATPSSVKHQKSGCKECAVYGFKMTKPAVMYYLRIIEKATGDHYFKIGITNRTSESRIVQMLRSCITIDVISVQAFTTGEGAFKTEQRILNDFDHYRVPNFKLLKNGNSEVFNKDLSEYLSCYYTLIT